jgi:acyl dehydratase
MSPAAATLERSFCQADFDRFARLSGDENPIHTDPQFSSRTHFGRTVAHGLLLCSVLRSLIEELVPGCVLLEQAVMFPAPTFTDEPMRFNVRPEPSEGNETQLSLTVERVHDGEITCQGHCRVTT